MIKNKIRTKEISEEKMIAVIFIVMIFSTLIFSIIKGYPKMEEEMLAIFHNNEKIKEGMLTFIQKKEDMET